MLMPGTATTDTDTVATDGGATTGLMATTVTTERGPLRLNLQLSQPLLLTLRLCRCLVWSLRIRWLLRLRTQIRLLPPLRILGLLGLSLPIEKWTRLRLRSSVDICQYFQSLRLVWAAGVCLVG